MTVVVAGEALMDLAPRGDLLVPLPGGGPYNVAMGLGRLGTDCRFLGRVSTDGFGQRLVARLRDEGVDTGLVVRTDDPTTLAVVHLDPRGQASYGFYVSGTSAGGLTADDLSALPAWPTAALHVSLGAIGLDTEAGAATTGLLGRHAGRSAVSFDPNVRRGVIRDLDGYARRMDELVTVCDLVKVSDEDLAVLYPGRDPGDTAARWAASGPVRVVMTCGPDGAVTFDARGNRGTVPGVDVEVVDTIGAGDAFTSGLLAWLDARGHLASRDALSGVDGPQFDAAVRYAATVAAMTCRRSGSDPPTAAEVERTIPSDDDSSAPSA